MTRLAIGKLLVFLSLFGAATPLLAADSAVTVNVRPKSVSVGETFELEVRVHSTGLGGPGEVVVPALDGLKQLGKRSSESVQIINGSATRQRVEVYTFAPLRAGEFTFRGIGVRKGKKFVAGPLVSLQVNDAAGSRGRTTAIAEEAPGLEEPGETAPGGIALPPPGKDVFVTAHVDKNEVYIGEPLLYTFRFYFRFHPERPTYDAPDFAGFQSYDLPQVQEPKTLSAHGRAYEYYDVRALLYPLRAGEIEISPAGLSFRSSFFFSREQRLSTQPVSVRVKPLPQNAPAAFDGAVGRFQVTSTVSSQEVSENDPVTLSLRISGTGNFGSIQAPPYSTSEFWRPYPGRASEQVSPTPHGLEGLKSFETLLMPSQSGDLPLPAFEFAWFDPQTERYEERTLGLGAIKVNGRAKLEETARKTPVLALRPLQMDAGKPIPDTLTPWRWLLWALPAPFVALGLLGAGRALQRRAGTVTEADVRLAARRRLERRLRNTTASPADILKAIDLYLHEGFSLSSSASEAEVRSRFGADAAPLLVFRSQLQAAVFGGASIDLRQTRKQLRAWLKRLALLAGIVFLPLVPQQAQAQKFGPLFHEALEAQSAGNYEEAIRLYRRAAEQDGVSSNLLYNLAGAASRAGDLGLARYAIERAFASSPGNEDIAFNRGLIARAVSSDGGSDKALLVGRLSLYSIGWAALGLWALFTAMIVFAWFVPWLRWAALAVFLLSLPVFAYGGWLYSHSLRNPVGVIWKEAALYESPSDQGGAMATAPAGDVASVVAKQAGWLKLQTGRGQVGWAQEAYWRAVPLIQAGQSIPE